MKQPLNPKERAKLFKEVFSSGRGADVLDEVLRLFGADADTFNENPYWHAYNAGQRAAAIKIKRIVETDLERLKNAETKA